MICCQFIFQPGTYDDDFHRLDGQIDEYARSLPGFERVEKWVAPEGGAANSLGSRSTSRRRIRYSAGTTDIALSSARCMPHTATAVSAEAAPTVQSSSPRR